MKLNHFIRNEAGSMTLLTLIVIQGLLCTLSLMMILYDTEKQFSELELTQLTHHSLHQMTYQTVINQLTTHETISELPNPLHFPHGQATYAIHTIEDQHLLYIESSTEPHYRVRRYYPVNKALLAH